MNLYRAGKETDIENKSMDAKGRKEGDRMNWESGTDICVYAYTHTHTHTHTQAHTTMCKVDS